MANPAIMKNSLAPPSLLYAMTEIQVRKTAIITLAIWRMIW
jgi:hypothetical protein